MYGQPGYGQPPAYGQWQPQQNASKGSGLAITALVLAILALLMCWIPIVNLFAALLAVVALVLGVIGFVRARKGNAGGKGMAAGAMIISVIALVGVIVVNVLFGALLDSAGDAIEDAADGNTSQSDDQQEAAAEAAPLGTQADVGDYTVSVDRVVLDATDQIAAANEFNEPAEGQYVLVSVTATYEGDETGTPWLDLDVQLAGSDHRMYSTSTCSATLESELSAEPDLQAGGTATGDVCFDVPPAALDGATIAVEESFSFDDEEAEYWQVQ
ncbi:DUF4352 domain-containing protein [Nocardioides insulae]|uniref:DUF4352 domain-containing protein n=1 Tax=Nocardioides insulae TaxID=394734 RepID=UPI0004008C7D|nr:DUF4352 domain-containing protein [Nocardioides insulae]